jgi:hypothetical protein|tara:strand:+ start:658 stop:1086 length:429 start_codon:yes stop_codon:yes gene_type:complete
MSDNNLDKVKIDGKIFVENSDECRKYIDPTWKPGELYVINGNALQRMEWPRHVLFEKARNKHYINIFMNPFFDRPSKKYIDNGGDYWFEYEDRCDTPEKLVNWIDHLSRKNWCNTKIIREIISAINNHHKKVTGKYIQDYNA